MPANSLDLTASDNTTWSWKPTTGGATASAKARAPRVNPYAAPQTVDRHVDETALPLAMLAESAGTRQLFPEQSTAALAAMVRKDRAITEVQMPWFIVTVLIGFWSVYYFKALLSDPSTTSLAGLIVVFGGVLTLARWRSGATRQTYDRYYALAMDGLMFLGSLGLMVWMFHSSSQGFMSKGRTRLPPTMIEWAVLLFSLPFLFYPAYYSLRSLQALWRGQFLFGPERLDAKSLQTELDYRRLHGIE